MKVLISLSIVLACTVLVCVGHAHIEAPNDIKIGDSFSFSCMAHLHNESWKIAEVGDSYEFTKDGKWFYRYHFAGNTTDTHDAPGIHQTQIEATSADPGLVKIINATIEAIGDYVCIFKFKPDVGIDGYNGTKHIALHTDTTDHHHSVASLHAFNLVCIAIVLLKFLL